MVTNKKQTVAFVAGRSGGHLLPCLTKARQAAEQEQASLLFFTTATTLDKKILDNFSVPCTTVFLPLDNVPYGKIWRYPLFVVHLISSFIISFYRVLRTRPQKIVSMGGYVSIPVCMSAWLLRIPIELYELNAIPGKAVKFLAPFARTIFVCFEESTQHLPHKKCTFAHYPVRFSTHNAPSQHHSRTELGLDPHKKTVLILGGSQGSLFLNTLMQKWTTTKNDFSTIQVIHQTGAHDATDWHRTYAAHNIQALIFDYSHHIEKMYQAADVVVCRAGAGTLFEVLFFGKQCITIPLETKTTEHQKNNAYAIAKQHPQLVTVLEQKIVEQNPETLFKEL